MRRLGPACETVEIGFFFFSACVFIGIERGADTFFICFTGCMWILLEGERDGFPAVFPHANVF